jgi:hypothetical protein
MPLTTKAVGWLAGRIGGSKAKNRTMNWMNKTGLGQVLGYGGDLGLMFGVGKGLQAAGKIGKLANTGIGRTATRAGNFLAGTPAVNGGAPGKSLAGRLSSGASKLANYAMDPKNALVTGQALMAGSNMYGNAQQQALANQQMEMQMDEMERQRREAEAAAEMLRPLFMSMFSGRR